MIPRKSDDPQGWAREMQKVVDAYAKYGNATAAARALGIHRTTYVSRYEAAVAAGIKSKYFEREAKGAIPKGRGDTPTPFVISGAHKILVISDVHVPYHDADALETAIEYGVSQGCDTCYINGDFQDCTAISRHEKTPAQRDSLGYELDQGRQVLEYIASRFARVYYKEGNHEARFPVYLARNAPELITAPGMSMKQFLRLDILGIEWIGQERPVRFGRLNVIHGHEYKGGGSVNVGRSKLLAAMDNVIFGHHHRTQEFIHRKADEKIIGSWGVGCLCSMYPDWLLKHQWNHGFAIVDVKDSGNFTVENKKLIDGQIF